MQTLTFDTPKMVCDKVLGGRKAKDHFLVFDNPKELSDYAGKHTPNDYKDTHPKDWTGGKSFWEAQHAAEQGAPELVEASDKLLDKYERFAWETHGKGWRNDVTGALPDVPAFIAGHPMNMRRRTRVESAAAPIAVIMDVCSSAGCSAETLQKRGAACLALVRILAMRRPVELWVACGMDDKAGNNSVWTLTRLETAPLDLATAAFMLTHAAAPRHLMYGGARGSQWGHAGRYAYGACWAHTPYTAQIVAPALPHISEVLAIPAIHMRENHWDNPEAWLEEKLASLLPQDLAA